MTDEQELKSKIDNCVDIMVQIESLRDSMKEAVDAAKDDLDMKKADFNRLVKLAYLKQYDYDKFVKEQAKAEDIERIEGMYE